MFVSETSIAASPSVIRLKVCSLEGTEVAIDVRSDTTVDQLKICVVSQFYHETDASKLSLYYKLLHVNSMSALNEEQNVLQAGLKQNDELLLLKKRISSPTGVTAQQGEGCSISPGSEEAGKLLTVADVARATEGTAVQNAARVSPESQSNNDQFQSELRKILVSLIDVAQKLVCFNPQAGQDAYKYIHREAPQTSVTATFIDNSAVQRLVDMGFSPQRARDALCLNRMSEADAVQWLIDNESSTGDVVMATGGAPATQTLQVAPAEMPLDDAAGVDCKSEEQVRMHELLCELSQQSSPQKVHSMLEAFREHKRRQFRPDVKLLYNLIEMGFPESDAVDALRIHCNRQDDACEWLLNRPEKATSTTDVVEVGLDTNNALYKAIMSSHVIQMSLSSPKTLLALLHMLDSPSSMHQWLTDPELNPLLVQVSRIYHAEKYAQ